MDKSITNRLRRLEASQLVREGDYVICDMADGAEKNLYWSDAAQSILNDEVKEIRPGMLQNGEGFALCKIFLENDDEQS